MFFISTEWNDFYQESPEFNYKDKTDRIEGTTSSYYVSFCRFINQNNRAISFYGLSSESTKLLVEDSFISSCSSSSGAGNSIWFNYEGQCVQNRICCEKSQGISSYAGAYCFVYVTNDISHQNKVVDCSITKTQNVGGSNIHLYNGETMISSTNVSFASIAWYSLYYVIGLKTDKVPDTISFSSFINNSQNESNPSAYFKLNSDASMKSCNYINNQGKTELLDCYPPNTYLNNCNFENNQVSELFRQNSKYITIDNCYIGENQNFTGSVTIIYRNHEKINNKLSHFSTYICENIYPMTKLKDDPKHEIEREVSKIFLLFVNVIYKF